ncbi:MAG: hypothetical protein OXH68_06710 [Gammaproteobacteria bacterium]|nr:hypothetical protein [Gammaproteobacteria bacterium]
MPSGVRHAFDRVADALGRWGRLAADLGVTGETRRLVERRLSEVRANNKALLANAASA